MIGGLVYEQDKLGIAGGVAFANGTSVNAAWGSDDSGGLDYEDMYINVAHSWGSMNVAIDYRSTDNNMNMEGRAVRTNVQLPLFESYGRACGGGCLSMSIAVWSMRAIVTTFAPSSQWQTR